jgi:beta-glucosidase
MTDKSEFAEAIAAAAKGADIVVMVLGEHGLQSGEGEAGSMVYQVSNKIIRRNI